MSEQAWQMKKLVDYIRGKGYEVHVIPQILQIYKVVGEHKITKNWMISDVELEQGHEFTFIEQADQYMREIDQAIIEKKENVRDRENALLAELLALLSTKYLPDDTYRQLLRIAHNQRRRE